VATSSPSSGDTLLERLSESVLERDPPGWRRQEIAPADLESFLVDGAEKYSRVYVGGAHFTIPELRTRFISFTEYPVTYGECAREYLRLCYDSAGVVPIRPRAHHRYWAKKAPLYCRPVKHRGLAYVDINHAYWEIVRHYAADHAMGYGPLEGEQVPGRVPFVLPDEIDAERRLRHTVVGTLLAHRLSWLEYGSWRDVAVPAPWANPSMARIIFDTMNAVARDVMAHTEVFAWMTDAAIVPNREAEAVQDVLAERWRLGSTIESRGQGAVWSPSCYRVGLKMSLDIAHKNATYVETPCAKVARVNVERTRRWRRDAT